MKKLMLGLAAVLLVASQSAQAALVFVVQNYTASSVTFSLSGQMPTVTPWLNPGPSRLNLRYTGNLWAGGETEVASTLSADPLAGAGGLDISFTGGFGGTSENFTMFEFQNDLTSLFGTGAPVTLSWDGSPLLNTSGSGTFELFWGSIAQGVDPQQESNVPFGATQVVDGRIVTDAGAVPEPAAIGLFGLGLLALGALRRRQR